MALAIIKCVVCGVTVRRDDNPLARDFELPRRLLLFKGPMQLHASDYCDPCFEELRGNLARTESELARSNENEGGQ